MNYAVNVEEKRITVFIDGLCQPVNPGGIATYGFVVYEDGVKIHEEAKFVGKGEGFSNNVAEYSALLAALTWLIQHQITKKVEVRSDSRLLVNQMNGDWKVRKGLYKKVLEKIKPLLGKFEYIRFRWIPREENVEADLLSRKAYEEYCHTHGLAARYSDVPS